MATGSRVSVIIPSRSEGDGLLKCLHAIQGHAGLREVIVAAHEERSEARARAAFDRELVWIDCPQPGRGRQMNAGAHLASGDVLLFLHADTRLPDGALRMVCGALEDRAVAGGAFQISFDVHHPALDLLSRVSATRWRGSFLGDQAMFCRRALFERLGGFWDRPLFEDVDLASRLRRHGTLVRIDARVCTSARRFVAGGPWRQLARNAALYARFRLGARVERLAREYGP